MDGDKNSMACKTSMVGNKDIEDDYKCSMAGNKDVEDNDKRSMAGNNNVKDDDKSSMAGNKIVTDSYNKDVTDNDKHSMAGNNYVKDDDKSSMAGNKDVTDSYNKYVTDSYNKDVTDSYNKDMTDSYNKDVTDSYNKDVGENNKSSMASNKDVAEDMHNGSCSFNNEVSTINDFNEVGGVSSINDFNKGNVRSINDFNNIAVNCIHDEIAETEDCNRQEATIKECQDKDLWHHENYCSYDDNVDGICLAEFGAKRHILALNEPDNNFEFVANTSNLDAIIGINEFNKIAMNSINDLRNEVEVGVNNINNFRNEVAINSSNDFNNEVVDGINDEIAEIADGLGIEDRANFPTRMQARETRKRRHSASGSVPACLIPRRNTCAHLEDVVANKASADELLGHKPLTYEVKLRLVRLFYHFAQLRLELTSREKPSMKLYEEVSAAFGVSRGTLVKVIDEWKSGKLDKSAESGPRAKMPKRGMTAIPENEQVQQDVYKFVQEENRCHARVTATQIIDFLIEKEHITLSNSESARASAQRAMRRWVIRKGYIRGKQTGKQSQKPSLEDILKRQAYIQALTQIRSAPSFERLREVYLDETFINHHHRSHLNEYIRHMNDNAPPYKKLQHKGKRLSILLAIQGQNPDSKGNSIDDLAGVIKESLLVLKPQPKAKQTKDYHGDFNGKIFLKWFEEQLIPNLSQPCVIIMDNASYHDCMPLDHPRPNSMTKIPLEMELCRRGIGHYSKAKVPQLRKLLHKALEGTKPACVQMAEAHGHRVLFTPPHLSNLQPIELLWGAVKGAVARGARMGRTFKDVEAHFHEVLDIFQEDVGDLRKDGRTFIQSYIDTVEKELDRYREEQMMDLYNKDENSTHDVVYEDEIGHEEDKASTTDYLLTPEE